MSRILIIDDDKNVREEIRDRVEIMGHEVVEAGHFDGALKMLEDFQFDLVLLDLAIPRKFQGVSQVAHGRSLLQRIVEGPPNPHPPVIVVTANGVNECRLPVSMMKLGAVDYIGKPLDYSSLEDAIRDAIGKNQTHPCAPGQQEDCFRGGTLFLLRDKIEFVGVGSDRGRIVIGGERGYGTIQKILRILMDKKDGEYPIVVSAKIAELVGGTLEKEKVPSVIQGFRDTSTKALNCGREDIIERNKGRGGYQLASHIEVEVEEEF